MEGNVVVSDKMRDDLLNPTTSGVDGITNNFGIMQLTTGSRFIVSNLAAFESYKQTYPTSSHRRAGKIHALKSSDRPVKKLLLLSEDRIRRNFNFSNLQDEDIIISSITWFEHISYESFTSGKCEDINTSTLSSRSSRASNPSNSEKYNVNDVITDPWANTEDVFPFFENC